MILRNIIGLPPAAGKRRIQSMLLLFAGITTQACPMFSDDAGCWYDGDCAPGFLCDRRNGTCFREPMVEPDSCSEPADCRVGETCSPDALCVPGDCTFSGCIAGWTCDVIDGRWGCRSETSAAGGMAGQAGSAGSAGSGNP